MGQDMDKTNRLSAQEVEDQFNAGEDLSDFFKEEVDPLTHKPVPDLSDSEKG